MEHIAVHTRLAPGCEEDYERIHRVVPAALADRLRHAGVHDWRIWRDGLDLFHVIDVEDYRAMRRALQDDPVNVEWQAAVNPLLVASDDYAGDDDGVPRVWSLADQLDAGDQPGAGDQLGAGDPLAAADQLDAGDPLAAADQLDAGDQPDPADGAAR